MKKIHLFFKALLIFLFLVNINQLSFAQISGKVFRDFNANGVQTTTAPDPIEPGLKDVTVNAYDATGTALTPATTSSTGTYSISGGTAPYRVEFILPSGYYASKGNASNTTVQFVAAAGIANLGVNAPSDYCQANPDIATNVYVNGDNSTGTSGTNDVLVKFPYNSTNITPSTTRLAAASDAGTTWGLAYQKETKKLFSTAYLKRHAGFGPSGTGGIYVTDATTNTTTSFVNLNGLAGTGISTGTNIHANLLGDKTQPSQDAAAFSAIGKLSFGDLDISDDGKYLFVVNMNSRQIHKIFINNPAVVPTAINITSYAIPNPCASSDYRPFALKYYKGKLYVGVVCSAETSQLTADLSANVYTMDPATGTFSASPVLSFPLNFTRGNPWRPDNRSNKWFPWQATWTNFFLHSDGVYTYPQPMLSDIEFDIDGAMILGFRDRIGDQLGVYNVFPNNTNMNGEPVTGGDIMRAAPNTTSTAWAIETNGIVGGLTSGVANGQGNGGSEFYKGDWFYGMHSTWGHEEISDGGLALLPGSGEIAMTAFDPRDESVGGGGYNSGGVRFMSNTNGAFADGYQIYNTGVTTGTFQKSNGMGDIEILCNPQPIEIGNLVFLDTDKDGIQDADETGINGVIIDLYQGATKVGSTTTATLNGQVGSYFFTNANVNLGGATGILPNTAYEIRIPNISGGSKQTNLGANVLTSANQGTNDLIDSDGTTSGTNAIIALTTVGSGENNHSYDFGFFFCPAITSPSATQTLCIGSNGSNITVNTTQTATNGIKFMRFASAQTGAAMYTGGTLLTNGTVTASGGIATYVWNSSDFPNAGTTPTTYYVYAILNPDLGAGCQPFQEIQIVVNPLPSFTLAQTNVSCFGDGNGKITTTTTSGTAPFTYSINDGTTFPNTTGIFDNLVPATYKIAVKDNNGCIKKCN